MSDFLLSDGQAKCIATHHYPTMASAMYTLAALGAIEPGRLHDEITRQLWLLDTEQRRPLLALDKYVRTAGERPPQDQWCYRSLDNAPVTAAQT